MSSPNRIIRLFDGIDSDSLLEFSERLEELEKTLKPITVELCNPGGDTYVGLAFYSKITNSKCKITIKAVGHVMSAATIILAAGHKRIMDKDCWFMVHDDCMKIKADSGEIAISLAKHKECVEFQWAEILSRKSNKDAYWWRIRSKETTYMTAEECLKVGIIDEIY